MIVVAATGFFDGVHLGHRMIIGKACSLAVENGGRCLVISFFPHPAEVLHKGAEAPFLLSSPEEKRRLCLEAGADDYIEIPFTEELASLSAEEFIKEYLIRKYGVTTLVLGYDHRFGANAPGTPVEMAEIVNSCGVKAVRMEEYSANGVGGISSTLIRKVLSEGDVESASTYLGYRYSIEGKVVSGNKIGRQIGFPTANMIPDFARKMIPACGVYSVTVLVKGEKYPGICNIGIRPTIEDGREQTIETHILEFNEDIYGENIRIEFIERIRDEVKFPSIEELKRQLAKDKDFVSKSPKVAYLCRNVNDLWK